MRPTTVMVKGAVGHHKGAEVELDINVLDGNTAVSLPINICSAAISNTYTSNKVYCLYQAPMVPLKGRS